MHFPSHYYYFRYREPSSKWRDYRKVIDSNRPPEPAFVPPPKFLSAVITPRKWRPTAREQRDRRNRHA